MSSRRVTTRSVGRVGALAVGLGIGAAAVSMPAVAAADATGSSGSGASISSSSKPKAAKTAGLRVTGRSSTPAHGGGGRSSSRAGGSYDSAARDARSGSNAAERDSRVPASLVTGEMDLALPAATGSVSPAPAKAIPAAAATASQSAGPGAAAAKRPIADLIRVFVGNGSAANPNAGLLFGNGFSYDASTCAGTSTCDGGRGGFLVGNGGDGWNGGSGGSAGLFGSGGAGGAAVSGVPGAWGGFGGRGGLLWGKRGPDGANEWSSWVFDPYPDPLIQEGDGSASGGVEPQPEAGAPGDGGSPRRHPDCGESAAGWLYRSLRRMD